MRILYKALKLPQNPKLLLLPVSNNYHMERNTVNFNNLKILVLTQLDEMLKWALKKI